jgi:hypothetical protein
MPYSSSTLVTAAREVREHGNVKRNSVHTFLGKRMRRNFHHGIVRALRERFVEQAC